MHEALELKGGCAVVTGAAYGGIGFSIAHLLLTRYSKRCVLADVSKEGLAAANDALIKEGIKEEDFITHQFDCTNLDEVKALAQRAYTDFERVDFLVLNAGTSRPTKDYGGDIEDWKAIMDVNFWGVANGTQAFVENMVKQDSPAAVVITGSKQGITSPPGNPAYNASKAAVKSLAESLSHSLLDTKVTAHLLIPGYTYTKLTSSGGSASDAAGEKKPAAAWSADQVAEELCARLDEFYIICPDNAVDWPLDQARIEWNAHDILEKRPALSRWHPDYKEAFAQFVEQRTGQKA